MASTLIIPLLLFPSFNALTCNGWVRYDTLIQQARPADVCLTDSEESTSIVYSCDSESVMEIAYDGVNCTGSVSSTTAICTECRSYCNLDECQYFVQREYENVQSCNGNQPIGDGSLYYVEKAWVIGYCHLNLFTYNRYENNGTHILNYEYPQQNGGCVGTPVISATGGSLNIGGIIGSSCRYTPPGVLELEGSFEASHIWFNTLPSISPSEEPTRIPSASPSPSPTTSRPTIDLPTISPTTCVHLNASRSANDENDIIQNTSLSIQQILNEFDYSSVNNSIDNYQYNCLMSQYSSCYVECDSWTPCNGTTTNIIDITSVNSSIFLECDDNACKSLRINMESSDLYSVNIHCFSPLSCKSLVFRSVDSNTYLNIFCFDLNSCQDMEITTDDGVFININMYKYSENVNLVHPNISHINMECDNPKNVRYIQYDIEPIPYEQELISLARVEYAGGRLPCEGITVDCADNDNDLTSCDVTYKEKLNNLNLNELFDSGGHCYWIAVSDLFEISCEGHCEDITIDYYQYNISVDFDIVFEENDAAGICDYYFNNTNRTSTSLRSMDGIFYFVLSILSSQDSFQFNQILLSPNTMLRYGLASIVCDPDFGTLPISTNFSMQSGIESDSDFALLFDENSVFVNKSEELLSKLFGVPSINIITPDQDEVLNSGGLLTLTHSYIIIGVAIFILTVAVLWVLFLRYRRNKELARLTTIISNPMVIAIAIGKYDSNPKESEVGDSVFSNLDAIDMDIKNLHELFAEALNYTFFPEYDINEKIKTHWTKTEIISLLKEKGGYLDDAVKSNDHDGLIVIISCHGIQDHIVTSDYKRINKDTIHRIFSVDHPSLRDIPGIFIYDCCDGDNDFVQGIARDEPDMHREHSESSIIVGDRTVADIYKSDEEIWYDGEPNPDYKLVIINGSNKGFQSKMGSKSGSLMINKFAQNVLQNVEDKSNKLFLFELFHVIQDDLHTANRQLVETKYNNKLEYIKFNKYRKDGDEDKQEEQIELNEMK